MPNGMLAETTLPNRGNTSRKIRSLARRISAAWSHRSFLPTRAGNTSGARAIGDTAPDHAAHHAGRFFEQLAAERDELVRAVQTDAIGGRHELGIAGQRNCAEIRQIRPRIVIEPPRPIARQQDGRGGRFPDRELREIVRHRFQGLDFPVVMNAEVEFAVDHNGVAYGPGASASN